MKEKLHATLSLERELAREFKLVEYETGNGDFHFHSQIEICIIEEGQLEALVNNSKTVLSKGDIAVSLSYDPHRYISSGKVKYSVLIIPDNICEIFYSVIQGKSLQTPFIRHSENNSMLSDYISIIRDPSSSELMKMGYVYLVLATIQKELLTANEGELPEQELISRILIYIHKNSNKQLTLSSLSKALGYHPTYLSSYFKSRLDIGFSQYVNLIRLKNAVRLMQQKPQNMNLTDIALECGFNSSRTFNRAFRNEFGCSPGQYFAAK